MRSLSILCVSLVCAGLALGQSSGTITGTVADPAAAVIAGAPVEAKNTSTGAVYKGATSGTGNYTISALPAGTYDVSVAAPGFKKEVRPGVEVVAATSFRVDFTLQVGQATESVTITAEAPELKTESGELSHNVTTDTMNSLPILSIGSDGAGVRNPLSALVLLPGANFASDANLVINGMPSSSQSIHIEGQDATNGFWKEINSQNQPGLDSIQEVVVETSNFAPEFGQAGGGYINYTMKSGTNQFHGGAFDYFRNEALNAGTPFTNAGLTNSEKDGQLVRNRLRQNDYGGTFGGPVKFGKLYNGTNKTFFFFSIENYANNISVNNGLASVPTPAYLQGNLTTSLGPRLTIGGVAQSDALGNAMYANEAFDPASQQTVNGQVVRNPFPNDTIPVTRFDPAVAKILALIPAPTIPNALVNNYQVPAYTNYTHTEVPTLKLDHNLSPTVKLSMYYSANREFSPGNDGYTQVWTPAQPTNSLSQTTRLNYDQTITPTLLMHVGAGLLQTTQYLVPQNTYNQSQLFGNNTYYIPYFPAISGTTTSVYGGVGVPLGASAVFALWEKETHPTFVNSFTWVKGNHTFKFGGELMFDGIPFSGAWRANGVYAFGSQETADPFSTGLTYANGVTGAAYGSFLLGAYNSVNVAGNDDARIGNHSFGMYAQDSWKVRRNLTIDYGLRYDFATLLSEEHGRMQDAAFHLENPTIDRNGTVIYGGDCSTLSACPLNKNYPYALGPRLGIAYQVDKKTVIRLGSGITYGTSPNNAYLNYSVPDFYALSDQPEAGVPAGGAFYLGNPFSPTNPFGIKPLVWPNFTPQYPFQTVPGYAPPESPFISIDRNAGRLPRQLQWSLGVQRELSRGLVVDVAYVGNRGVWWTAPLLDIPNYNGLTLQQVAAAGINTSSASSMALLNTPITSPLVQQAYPNLKIVTLPSGYQVVPSVYASFPATQTLGQALRAEPQWDGVPPFLGPPLGDTWYDSLQLKVTQRFTHGLTANYAFSWQKGLDLGAGADTSYLTPDAPRINDVNNYGQNKQLNGLVYPLVSIISVTYNTPKIPGDSQAIKGLSWLTKDWTLAGVFRYQSGALLATPNSNNNLLSELQVGAANNPALWGGGATSQNLVPGQSLFAPGITPNCGCFDPTKTLVLNPAAWTDNPTGQYGSAPFYMNNYRWQRQPGETASIGRIFPLSKENKVKLQIRMEFITNLFNRTFLSAPSASNPSTPTLYTNQFQNGQAGALSNGYGFVSTVNGAGTQPRQGQIVARLTF